MCGKTHGFVLDTTYHSRQASEGVHGPATGSRTNSGMIQVVDEQGQELQDLCAMITYYV